MGPSTNKFKSVEMPHGVIDMFSLMGFLTDPKKYKKHLMELKKFTDDANKAVEYVGKAKEIEALLVSTKAKQEKADTVVGEAEKEASEIIARATESIVKQKQETEILLQQATDAKEKYTLLSKAKATELKTRDQDLVKAENNLANRIKQLENRENQVAKDVAEIAEKKKLLASL
jgi:hypothetical protein